MQPARIADTSSPQAKRLGPLMHLPGTWKSLSGHGWNMIALPFATRPESRLDYRLLVNQYDEELTFSEVDDNIPNRGIERFEHLSIQTDQRLVALDYEQMIRQIAADDFPRSGQQGDQCLPIHHEPGLWLHMLNERTEELDIARMATIPHGDALLAMGRSTTMEGAPAIPDIDGLPIGVDQDINHPYLSPYQHFHNTPFKEVFDPVSPNALLKGANEGQNIVRTTMLNVDTRIQNGGINNIPFIVKQANATEMQFTLWIQELAETDDRGDPIMRLQYSQTVMLEFFDRRDGVKGLIKWPHVSINTLVRSDQVDTVHVCTGMNLA